MEAGQGSGNDIRGGGAAGPWLNGWSTRPYRAWEKESPEGATGDSEGSIGSFKTWAGSSRKASLAQLGPIWLRAVRWDTERRERRQ